VITIGEGERCGNYKYTTQQILISIKCFLGSSAGFRGLSSVFQILSEWISSFITPAYTTIRQWLLKIGLYKLQCPKYSPSGWFFIVDTSIQMGPQKCVVVLGVKNLDINQNFCPTLDAVAPLVVKPLTNSPGEVVNELLEAAAAVTGTPPIGIISDEGAENKKGVRLFVQNHSETVHLFDASHKINNCLKEELNNDPVWLAFKASAANSIQHLKLLLLLIWSLHGNALKTGCIVHFISLIGEFIPYIFLILKKQQLLQLMKGVKLTG
jgi:hypothetical protein